MKIYICIFKSNKNSKKKSGRNKFKYISDYSNENGINLSNK